MADAAADDDNVTNDDADSTTDGSTFSVETTPDEVVDVTTGL